MSASGGLSPAPSDDDGGVRDVEVLSFGCRLNIVESATMRALAEQAGHKNLVIVNSCAVTAESVRQTRQAIRRLKRERPQTKIVVTGCAAQINPRSFAEMEQVAHVIGNGEKTLATSWARLDARVNVGPAFPPFPSGAKASALAAIEGRTRAFLAIQNGCDHRCTFCVIPQGRGPSRSAPLEDVLAQARRFVATGHKEIVLTGVDLTSWGGDLAGAPKLGSLARALLKALPELPRLRLSSIDCIEADADLLAAFAEEERLAPYLHLSLQAGDDLILKRMKRRHSRKDSVEFCATLRRLRPDIVFGADLIAGFPTEDEAMARASLDLIDDCGLSYLHVFPFSPRPGAPAARMPQVAPGVIKARAARLREAGAQALQAHLRARVGKTMRVLSERGGLARAADFTPVRIAGAAPGRLIDVTPQGVDGDALYAVTFDS